MDGLRDQLDAIEKLTFARFMEMKNAFLKRIRMVWLIEGHLTDADALKMVEITEDAIGAFDPVKKEDFKVGVCRKLKEGHIYNMESINTSDKSKNSGCLVVHQMGSDASYYNNAVAHVLASILHEPAFKTLRTDDKLGYTVKLSKESIFNVNHISIFVQSSKFDPLYVETRINLFLKKMYDKLMAGLNDENESTSKSVENNKTSIINEIRTLPPNLKEGAQFDWQQLSREEYSFARRDEAEKAIKKVTTKEVLELFKQAFFEKPRRINIRQFAPGHFNDEAKKTENRGELDKTYAEWTPNTPYTIFNIELDGQNGAHEKIKNIAAYQEQCENQDYMRNEKRF